MKFHLRLSPHLTHEDDRDYCNAVDKLQGSLYNSISKPEYRSCVDALPQIFPQSLNKKKTYVSVQAKVHFNRQKVG